VPFDLPGHPELRRLFGKLRVVPNNAERGVEPTGFFLRVLRVLRVDVIIMPTLP